MPTELERAIRLLALEIIPVSISEVMTLCPFCLKGHWWMVGETLYDCECGRVYEKVLGMEEVNIYELP